MPFAVGETVGPYRILEQLGQGGMATVYKAYHASLDRYVALKVLHQAFLEDANFHARFQREARLVAKLEHPNIVPIYDFAEHNGQPYLVMKFIEGETLKARLGRGPLSSDEIERVINAIGPALTYAHKQGILHRDVKPSNVLLAADGQIYLADFGLARIAQAGESTLTSDMILGTPQYISPEQAMGKKELDEGTDIYSFGVMLYELAVGKVPFSADTPFSIIHDHIYTPLPLPRMVNPNVPEPVQRVLLKALSKERADRHADVSTLVAAFKSAWGDSGIPDQPETIAAASAGIRPDVEGQAPVPAPAPPAPEEKAPKKGISKWVLIASSLLLILCCLVFLWATRGTRLEARQTASQTAAAQATGQPQMPPASSPNPPVSGPVEEARRRAEENPGDPYARLDLAIALADARRMDEAVNQLHKSADLAGEDREFFTAASTRLVELAFWPGAAFMNFRIAKMEGENLSPESRTELHKLVYLAFADRIAPQVLPFEEIGRLDEPLMLVAQTRFALHQRGPDESQRWLDQLKKLKPELQEIRLLQAEIHLWRSEFDQTRGLLQGLLDDPAIPPWIKTEAEYMMKEIP
jgi:tRNA A-37 threonylcarbamoyl transferase component Bud32